MKPSIIPIAFLALCLSVNAGVRLERIASGFDRPLWLGCPAGVDDYLWVAEQKGKIFVIDKASGNRVAEPFLDLTHKTGISANERGLLGLAFSPDFNESGVFFLNLTNNDGDTEIIRVNTRKDNILRAEPSSAKVLLKIKQDFSNHNGGFIGFGPDGMLYIGMGDGGSSNDPNNNAQNKKSLLGKMLRIDVSKNESYVIPPDNPYGDEIWMTGLRNPWRCSWDTETKKFWIADVGQNKLEEINLVPAGQGKGMDFGWRLREGSIATPTNNVGGDRPNGAIDPIYEYPHDNSPLGGYSVTGGHVYRGSISALKGRYIFADYQLPRLWSFVENNGKTTDFQNLSKLLENAEPKIRMVSSFGIDNEGELYVVDHHTGAIHKFVE